MFEVREILKAYLFAKNQTIKVIEITNLKRSKSILFRLVLIKFVLFADQQSA